MEDPSLAISSPVLFDPDTDTDPDPDSRTHTPTHTRIPVGIRHDLRRGGDAAALPASRFL